MKIGVVKYRPQGVIYVNAGQNIDIQVKSIEFVIERKSTPVWRVNSNRSRGCYVLAYAQSGGAFYNIEGEDFYVKKGNVLLVKTVRCTRRKPTPQIRGCFTDLALPLKRAMRKPKS